MRVMAELLHSYVRYWEFRRPSATSRIKASLLVYAGSCRDMPHSHEKKIRVLSYFCMRFARQEESSSSSSSSSSSMTTTIPALPITTPLDGSALDGTESIALESAMPYVRSWQRTKYAMVFRYSDGSVQANFADHVKLVLWSCGNSVSVIDTKSRTALMSVKELEARSVRDNLDLSKRLAFIHEWLANQGANSVGGSSMSSTTTTTTTTTTMSSASMASLSSATSTVSTSSSSTTLAGSAAIAVE
jgi:hypothetical protein